jgi:hypothetical protein
MLENPIVSRIERRNAILKEVVRYIIQFTGIMYKVRSFLAE